MVERRFVQGTPADIGLLPNNDKRLLNAQHTLQAIAQTGLPQILVYIFHHVRDDDACGEIYAVLDTPNRRSWADSTRGMGMNKDDHPRAVQMLGALGVITRDFEQRGWQRSESRVERIKLLDEYHDAMAVMLEAIEHANSDASKIIMLAPVLAVALYTARWQPQAALEFWTKMAHDDGLMKGEPERALLSYCRNKRQYLSGKPHLSAPTCRAVAAAWNNRWNDNAVETIKPSLMTTFRLLGTPLKKGLVVVEETTEESVRQFWSDSDVQRLIEGARNRESATFIGLALGRTAGAVRQKALTLNLSLDTRGERGDDGGDDGGSADGAGP
jgi:hypothetical protein